MTKEEALQCVKEFTRCMREDVKMSPEFEAKFPAEFIVELHELWSDGWNQGYCACGGDEAYESMRY